MGDDGEAKADKRFDHIKDRIAFGFPKLAGSKLDKALAAEEVRYETYTLTTIVFDVPYYFLFPRS